VQPAARGLSAAVIAGIGLGHAGVHLDTAVRGHREPRKRCCAVQLRAPCDRESMQGRGSY
jgi:hypothetical protein